MACWRFVLNLQFVLGLVTFWSDLLAATMFAGSTVGAQNMLLVRTKKGTVSNCNEN